MNDPGLDPDTAERMLRGEPTGPPGLARLLATASAHPQTARTEGEEAALAAYRAAHASHQARRRRRQISGLISLKAALIGLAILLTGGIAMAATAHHLANPPQNRQPHHGTTVDTSRTFLTHGVPRRSVRPSAERPTPRPAYPAPSHPRPTPHKKIKTHPVNTPKGKTRGNPDKIVPGT